MLRSVTPLAIFALVVSACSGPAASTAPSVAASQPAATAAGSAPAASAPAASGADLTSLIDAAKKEGTVTTIALPHDWCNYGEVIDGFKAKYGLAVNELNPDAGSGDEIEAIKANKDNPGPAGAGRHRRRQRLRRPGQDRQADPAVQGLDMGHDRSQAQGSRRVLVRRLLQHHDLRGEQGRRANSPADWSDLLKPEYKNQVALAGDPRASSQAISAVYAAALANGGSLDDAQKGLDFFKQLKDAGNFVPTIAKPGTIDTGATPIALRWAYNALAHKDTAAGNPEIDVVVPTAGRFLGVYVQAISAYAPHPNAAKLWEEYLYSDEGQAGWLKGYCHTTRLDDLKARGVSSDLIAKLPDIAGAIYPTPAQYDKAKTLITGQWDAVVGADVK